MLVLFPDGLCGREYCLGGEWRDVNRVHYQTFPRFKSQAFCSKNACMGNLIYPNNRHALFKKVQIQIDYVLVLIEISLNLDVSVLDL